jgi:hypothetical protein
VFDAVSQRITAHQAAEPPPPNRLAIAHFFTAQLFQRRSPVQKLCEIVVLMLLKNANVAQRLKG